MSLIPSAWASVPDWMRKVSVTVNDLLGRTQYEKGGYDCSANPNYPKALVNEVYTVTGAGKIGGASGTTVAVGDRFMATATNDGGTQAGVGSSWKIIYANYAAGGSAVLGPAWTTFTLSGSTSTQLGKAGCNAATTTITLADNQRLEIEAYVYKTAGNEAILGVTNGTDGLYLSAQADGNIRPYYYKSGAATGIGGTGVDALHNITATYDMQWRIHNRPSSRQSVLAVSEGSWASTSFMTDVNVSINLSTTLTLFVRTDDTTKCYLRARIFS